MEIVYTENERYSFPEHNHISTYTIGVIAAGNVDLCRRNQSVQYRENQFFIIPPYEPHSITADAPYTMVSISVKADLVRRPEEASLIISGFTGALAEKGVIPPSSLHVLENAMDTLFRLGVSEYGCDASIRPAKEIIEGMPQAYVTVDQLSQSVFMSKYNFIREFKRQVGLTPHSFQIQNRIRKAQRLLSGNSRASVTQVALATGFYDQSHFIKSFKRLVGVSPSRYAGAQVRIDD